MRRTRRWQWVTGIVVVVVTYLVLLGAYAFGGGNAIPEASFSFPRGGAAVFLAIRSVDAAAPSMDVDVLLLPDPDLLDGQGTPKEPITLVLGPTRDGADMVWPTGRRVDTRHATVEMLGDIQNWPFDSYTTTVVAQAYSGVGVESELPTAFGVDGAVQGWHLAVTPASEQTSLLTDVRAHRTVGIIAFGLLLLAVLITLSGVAMFVVVNTYRGRRKFEPAFLAWIAAMLFATIPIRNFLPGSPPPGSWVDIAVVLWVIVALGTALVFGVGTWWRYGRPPD